MRVIAALTLVAFAPQAFSQEAKKPDPFPARVEKFDFPKTTEVGEEFSLAARLTTNHDRVALVSVRMQLSENIQVSAPMEQHIFLEPNSSQSVSWKAKRVGAGEMKGFLGSYLVAEKRGSGQPIPEADKTALEREWAGEYTSTGTAFDAKLRLRVLPDGAVEGRIHWTYTRTDREESKRHIGRTGIEFVWGTYDPKMRLLLIDGYRRDDPQAILGLDRYRLTLAERNQALGGTTWANGTNDGRINLTPR